MVNPMIAAGQVHGAIAQGVGQALLEHADLRSANSGQLLAGSFMDYAMPRADDLPSFDLGFNGTPLHDQPAGRERLRRGRRDRGLSRHRQRHPRCPGAARRHGFRRARRRRRVFGRPCRRPDEAPRSRDRAQPPAHPRRAAASLPPRAGAGSRQRLGRACGALRGGPAQLVFQPSDPDEEALASIDAWAQRAVF